MQFRGRWVLITGASSGLGREFARRLAYEHGANLVIVARRADRLRAVRDELEARAAVNVRLVTADLSNLAEVDAALAQATKDIRLYGAILNAGVTYFGKHEALPWSQFELMLHTNVTGVVRMTNVLLPMLEAHPGGGLMLVSSMSGLLPTAYQTAYSATKAFLVNFGSGLHQELRGRGVSLTTFAPGGIATEMTAGESFRPLRGWLAPVEDAAKEGIKGMIRRKALHVPGWPNRLAVAANATLSGDFVVRRLAAAYCKALSKTGGTRGSASSASDPA